MERKAPQNNDTQCQVPNCIATSKLSGMTYFRHSKMATQHITDN